MTGITPTGPDWTFTRKQLLEYRDAEAQRLREKWAEKEESDDDTPE